MAALLLAGCGQLPALPFAAGPTPAPVPVEGPALIVTTPRAVAMLPVQQAGPRRLWRGDGNVALATDGARIVATAGFGQMLMATRFDSPDPLEDPTALQGREAQARRSVDLQGSGRDAASMRFGVALDCMLRGAMDGAWMVIEETCRGEGLGFTNRFWAEPATGAVRRSRQWAGDALGAFEVTVQD